MQNADKTHLLIIRLSSMGDVAMVVPVVKAFRRNNPDVPVTVLTRPFFRPFFDGIEDVDFLVPDFNGRHKGLLGIVRLRRDIEAYRITHVADMHDVLRAKILRRLLRLSGKKIAVIDKGRAEKRALTRKYHKFKVQLKHTVERYRETLLRLGFDVPEPVPAANVRSDIPDTISKITGPKNGVWIGVAPFAKHRGKVYPAALCDRLIGMLSEKYGRIFIFGGGQYEKEFAETMQERHEGVVSVIGRIGLAEELELISNIDVMVSMDSSAMHMASLKGVPAVSVWGATHPFSGFMGFGQDPANAVQLDMACRPCSVYGDKPCMFKDYRCMGKIRPKMVYDRIEKVLNLSST